MLQNIIPQLWAQTVLRSLDPRWLQARQAELAWLRKSLEADLLPDWCIEMVLEAW